MDSKLLSISIPTYNRAGLLKELLGNILSFQSDEIEVVVTDNQSSDETAEILANIKDERLKIFKNSESVPGYYNMIIGLFNASGKYVIHCNDRDLLFTDKLPALLRVLREGNYSYVQTTRGYLEPSYKISIYEKGFDSLIHQKHSNHPTGMIFNVEIMHNYLNRENYKKYVDDTFTYSFLMRDLLVFEKSAWFDVGCWNERPSRIKLEVKSGSVYKGGLYFEPDRISVFMRSVLNHLIDNPHFVLNEEQKEKLILNILEYFHDQLMLKKTCYADNRECMHYGMKKQFMSIFQMKEIYQEYYNDVVSELMKLNVDDTTLVKWESMQKNYLERLMTDCLKADLDIILKKIRRKINPLYPY